MKLLLEAAQKFLAGPHEPLRGKSDRSMLNVDIEIQGTPPEIKIALESRWVTLVVKSKC